MDQFLLDTEFNGAVLVAKNGKVVFKKAYGFGDIDQKVKLIPKSSFNLASVSKQFTATGIMILFEKNKLKLDDPVAKYLPQFSYVKEITIRHLLNHTSGLPDIYGILESQWDKSKIAGNEVLLNVFANQKPKLLFKPGEKMRYSNTGYITLASIIEKVSGHPFFEFMEKNIFKPLKMNDTYAYYKTMKEYPRSERVWGLKRQDGKTVLNDLIYCDGMIGDGNVHSSIEDLFKWDQALYAEKLLKKKTLKMMFTPGRLNNGESFAYGFGWGVTDSGKKVHHGGGWVGFRSFIMRYLDKKDTIIVLINCVSPKKGKTGEKIKSLYHMQ
ncbi:MAG: beta-lactamase family protein [Candidatus Aminicenantes bacterium]|nr:beta-lactamase family protein [Candidatus Aminicenantes bacterium]